MQDLHVIAVVSNPCRYQSRYRLYEDFSKHALDSGAILHTVESAFGERPHAVTASGFENHHQVRTSSELWDKEPLINYGLSRLPADWKYVAWVDADITFSRPEWVSETVHQLQHFPLVQMFSEAHDLGPQYQSLHKHTGFAYGYVHGLKMGKGYSSLVHPGFAWAARREFLESTGGLIDFSILGAGDRNMACGMIGKIDGSVVPGLSAAYMEELHRWQDRAIRYGKKNLGYVPGSIFHHWHGKKRDRKYADRWKILVEEQYNPRTDIKRDTQGIYQLVVESERQIRLRDRLRMYFRSRNEDSIDLA